MPGSLDRAVTAMTIADAAGDVVTDTAGILAVLSKYYESLYDSKLEVTDDNYLDQTTLIWVDGAVREWLNVLISLEAC